MAGRLGTPRWGATIAEPAGRIIWQSGDDDLADWSFTRELCDVSEGEVTLPSMPELAGRVEPWLHTLTFWADTEPAWHGIIMSVESDAKELKISAVDGAVFFKKRRVPSGRTWDQADASQVMAQMVVDAMSPSDPLQVADHLQSLDSRVWVVVDETANAVMLDDVVSDLTEAGLEWTFTGGALLIGPIASRYRTLTLTDKHLGSGVKVTKQGKDVITDTLVTGDGVWAQEAIPDDRIVVQSITKGNKLATEQECRTLAQSVLAEHGVSPVMVDVPDSTLTPDTPIALSELVPGVIVPVSSAQTGIRVGVDMRLEKLTVDSGKVKIALGTQGVSWETRQAFPPAPTMDHQSPWHKEQGNKTAAAAGEDKAYDADWVKPGTPL